jgi:hypothetical protein
VTLPVAKPRAWCAASDRPAASGEDVSLLEDGGVLFRTSRFSPMKALVVVLVLLSSFAAYAQEDPFFRRAGEEDLDKSTVAMLNQMFLWASQSRERAAFVMPLRERTEPPRSVSCPTNTGPLAAL